MINQAITFGEELKSRILTYKLHNTLWNNFDLLQIDLSLNKWTTIKYLNDQCDGLNSSLNELPRNSGGLYMFSIKCPIIPGMTDYPIYIGRALLTDQQNLFKRCREYFQKFAQGNERPKITMMFRYWSAELYLSYIPLADNQTIADQEKRLINALLLPFNDQIPDVTIRQAVKAFNL